MRRASFIVTVVLFTIASRGAAEAPPIDFGREVFPVLQRACVECHGPEKQRGKLRLDSREAAFKSRSVIVPGNPEKSELIRRVSLDKDHEEVMPARGEQLRPVEIARLREWIRQGAKWPDGVQSARHWAYVKPVRAPLPTVKNRDWPRNAVDHFILARLEKEGLALSPEADRHTLIRRVSLDLIGLPPSPAEVDAFVNDANPQAYERLVDRLLASPQFGERWARPWLDLARYADSHGFQRDDLREIWAYRDWVIRALNDDMPYDRFTVEQIAGDLLANATEAQKIATGFHRCTPTNVEAGSEPEETRVNQVFDRVNTTAAVWLGSTLECAQCHDHKFDPFSQKDYYRLFAYFNGTAAEAERANPKVPGSIRFLGPSMPLKDAPGAAERDQLSATLRKVDADLAERRKQLAKDLEAWERTLAGKMKDAPREHVLEAADFDSVGGAPHKVLEDHSILLVDDPPDRDTYTVTVHTKLRGITGFKLEALTHDSLPGNGPGRGDAQRPNFVLNTFAVSAAPQGKDEGKPVVLTDARASFSQKNFDVAGAIDDDQKTAWAINPKFHESHWAVFRVKDLVGFEGGTTLTFRLVQQYGAGRTIGRLRLSALTGDPKAKSLPAEVATILETPREKRTGEQNKRLIEHRLTEDSDSSRLLAERVRVERELQQLKPSMTLVMQELPTSRSTHVLLRGDFRTPGDRVSPGAPSILHPAAEGPPSRLTLARWLVSRENPLAARVAVNRWWAELFGRGLVSTPEDFGIKGEPPTHPELLDWLAVEFMDRQWSMKEVLRVMVTSATYRQSSRVTAELMARDDQNRLYARGPRFRLDAETIRDNALAVSGLLSPKQYGPPIRPYQPDGLWTKVGGDRVEYIVSPGEDRHRRGVYVVWKRATPYPSFVNFDATARTACTVKRSRSNTPLQALTLLNDPVYVEAAKGLAGRVLTERPEGSVEKRIDHAFRLCLGRMPADNERAILRRLIDRQLAGYAAKPQAALEIVGDFRLPRGVAAHEFAAWYAVAAALLNLDETITKG